MMVNAFLEARVGSLRVGESIETRSFDRFRLRDRRPRLGRNPRTGARVRVPAKRICYFRPGSILLEIVNS